MLILYDRDWTAAGKKFVPVLEITPGSADGRRRYTVTWKNVGQQEQALHEYGIGPAAQIQANGLPDSIWPGERFKEEPPIYRHSPCLPNGSLDSC